MVLTFKQCLRFTKKMSHLLKCWHFVLFITKDGPLISDFVQSEHQCVCLYLCNLRCLLVIPVSDGLRVCVCICVCRKLISQCVIRD